MTFILAIIFYHHFGHIAFKKWKGILKCLFFFKPPLGKGLYIFMLSICNRHTNWFLIQLCQWWLYEHIHEISNGKRIRMLMLSFYLKLQMYEAWINFDSYFIFKIVALIVECFSVNSYCKWYKDICITMFSSFCHASFHAIWIHVSINCYGVTSRIPLFDLGNNGL